MAAIPISYNVRSLFVRKATTAAAAIGIALVVFVFSTVNMLGNGIEKTLGRSGGQDIAIVISKGSDAELSSNVGLENIALVGAMPQVHQRSSGVPDAVGELVGVLALDKLGADGISNVQIRGVPEDVWDFRPEAHIVEGRMPHPGSDEVAVGSAIRGRFRGLEVGQEFEIRSNRNVRVVGVFEAGGSSYESEVWADIETVRTAFGRPGLVSSVRVRLRSADAFAAFEREAESDRRLRLEAMRETEYYEKQSENSAAFLRGLGLTIAVLFSIGAMIGAMITMYSAVANRSREIGTLRALGFSRGAILFSFLLESVLLSLIGGTVGALASLGMGFVKFSIVNFASWSELVFAFEATSGIVLGSVIFAAVLGLIGGIFPAVRASRVSVLDALRA